MPPGLTLPNSDVGDGVAGLDAREPGLEDRRRVVGDVLERQRAAVEEHDRDRLARSRRSPRSAPPACPGRSSVAARVGLAAHLARLAEGEHDLVGRPRRGDRVGEAGVGPQPSGSVCGELGVRERAGLRERRRAGVLRVDARRTAVTASSSSPRPHHGPSMSCLSSPSGPITAVVLRRVERQRRALVLEQHHRAARGARARPPRVAAAAAAPRPALRRRRRTGARTGRRGTSPAGSGARRR